DDLIRAYGLASLDGLGVEAGDGVAVGAAGALLRYARELKPGGLPHLARPRLVRRGDVLPLDEMTRRNLELLEPLRAGAARTAASTSGETPGTAASPTSPACRRASASAPASARSRSGSTRCSGTTSRSRGPTSIRCRPTTSGARRSRARSGS